MKVSVGQRLERVWDYVETYPMRSRWFAVLWVLGLGGLAFCWHLGSVGLVDETEPLFAEAARQMTVTGDWITPYFNAVTRFDKPPLIYWLMAIAYKILGVNEWAARLPSAWSAIALMGMGFHTLSRFGISQPDSHTPPRSLWLAAVIGSALMALHPLTIVWARTGVSDMLLSACIGLSLMAFFWGYAGGERNDQGDRSTLGTASSDATQTIGKVAFTPGYGAFYLFIALGVLTKGPVGLVLPGIIVTTFLLYVGRFKVVLREMRPLWGGLFILMLVLPWYVLVTLANGEAFINSFFGYHNIERFTSVVNRHQGPWFFYFLIVLVGFAPWSFYLPSAMVRLRFWQRSRWRNQPRSTHLGLFAFFWFISIFGFFTVAVTKLPSYVLPLMPAAAMLVALLWSGQLTQPSQPAWGIKLSGILNGLFFVGFGGVLLYTPQLVKGDRSMPALAALLQASGLPIIGGAIAITTAIAIVVVLLSRQSRWLWLVNLVSMILLVAVVLLPAFTIVDSQLQFPLRQLAQVITQTKQPNEEVVMIGLARPSVVFYTRQRVTFKYSPQAAVKHLQETMLRQPETPTVMLLSYPEPLEKMGLKPDQYQRLGTAVPYQVVRVGREAIAQLPNQP